MSDGYTCPNEGCDYGDGENESKSVAAVRSHINAAEGHDWHELKADLYAAAEDAETPDETTDEESVDDPGEVADSSGETDHSGTAESDDENDQTDGDSEEMATDEEYQEQYDDGGESSEQNDTDDQPDVPEDDDGESGLSLPAFSTTTWLFIGGLLLAALVAYKLFGEDAAEGYESPEEQTDSSEQDSGAMLPEDVVETGTGGVQT